VLTDRFSGWKMWEDGRFIIIVYILHVVSF